ncbi:hypothetical protein A2J01_05340 [Rhodococcus sp. EPR-134]|nr:hypothetical protein A2J01_05340 [Rhodococcus sp. EPR-134]
MFDVGDPEMPEGKRASPAHLVLDPHGAGGAPMSERVKPERVKCQRTLPAELSSPSDAAISRLPMSARRSFGATDASHRTARVGKSGVAWGLLRKADALLEEAIGAGDPADRFRCAYLAALRGAGAVLAAAPAGAGSKRKRSGNAWVLMDAAAPAFGAWSKFFAGWSSTRAAVETGVSIVITDSDSDAFFAEVGRFLTAVEDFIGQDASEHLRA